MGQTRYEQGDGTITRARQLRQDSTPAEDRLWAILRGRGLDGFKFRRQQRLAGFYGDFVCQEARLVVEVDGETHAGVNAERKDAFRTSRLAEEGYRVIRFSNAEVMTNVEGVADVIRAALADRPSPSHASHGPLPLPLRGEGI